MSTITQCACQKCVKTDLGMFWQIKEVCPVASQEGSSERIFLGVPISAQTAVSLALPKGASWPSLCGADLCLSTSPRP